MADRSGEGLPGGIEGYARTYGARAYHEGLEMLNGDYTFNWTPRR